MQDLEVSADPSTAGNSMAARESQADQQVDNLAKAEEADETLSANSDELPAQMLPSPPLQYAPAPDVTGTKSNRQTPPHVTKQNSTTCKPALLQKDQPPRTGPICTSRNLAPGASPHAEFGHMLAT